MAHRKTAPAMTGWRAVLSTLFHAAPLAKATRSLTTLESVAYPPKPLRRRDAITSANPSRDAGSFDSQGRFSRPAPRLRRSASHRTNLPGGGPREKIGRAHV